MQSPRSFWGAMCGAGGLGGDQEEACGAWRGPRRGVRGWRARQGPRRGTGGLLGQGSDSAPGYEWGLQTSDARQAAGCRNVLFWTEDERG